jgi:hypothetical protein
VTGASKFPNQIAYLAMAVGALGVACSKPKPDAAPVTTAASAQASGAEADARPTVLDWVERFDACTASYQGELVDLGDRGTRDRVSTPGGTAESRERDGATWTSVTGRALDVTFFSPDELTSDAGIVVQARVRGGAAKGASVFLNGRSLGALHFARGETSVPRLHAHAGVVARGKNELSLRFSVSAKSRETAADVDWIRLGTEEGDATYAAPTRQDLLSSVTIHGLARRSVSTRAPGHVRCSGWVPSASTFEGWAASVGGEGDAEVWLRVDRAEPRVVGRVHVSPEAWTHVSFPLGDVGAPASVELRAVSAPKGTRVVFGEPRVLGPAAPAPATPRAPTKSGNLLVVVLGSMTPASLSARGGRIPTPTLDALAKGALDLTAHRSSGGRAASSLASMLTGVTPNELGMRGVETALPPQAVTTAVAARQAGISTAMFTANPTTFEAFGFARGWETFTARAPAQDGSAAGVFEDAAAFIDAHKDGRFFVLVHARGGHPPWDIGADELRAMTPQGYTGRFDTRHAAETLTKAKRSSAARIFTDVDRQLAFAMHEHAVAAHDEALGKLLTRLRAAGHEDDTTVIVVGDVGVDPGAPFPFIEQDTLDEPELDALLFVRPTKALGREPARLDAYSSSVDIARTSLGALGLAPPSGMRGLDLLSLSSPLARPQLASLGTKGSVRWGPFVWGSASGREGKLCSLVIEPACVSDVRATHPIAEEVLQRVAFDELFAKSKHGDAADPPPLDDATSAALRAWGRARPERKSR